MTGRNKWNAKKVTEDGVTFDSQIEHRRYRQLKLLVMAGEITDLVIHPDTEIVLFPKEVGHDKKVINPIKYQPDFIYWSVRDATYVIEDVKGKETRDFALKWNLLRRQFARWPYYKDKPVRLVKVTKKDI